MELNRLQSHQLLAILRGESLKALRVTWELATNDVYQLDKKIQKSVSDLFGKMFLERRYYHQILDITKPKLVTYYKRKMKAEAKSRAEKASVEIFGKNLKSLLLTQPAEVKKSVLAIDPGFSNGCNFLNFKDRHPIS